jgi:hypothetical protein
MNENVNRNFEIPLILIGAGGRNSGKTHLAKEIIRRVKKKRAVVALKITTVEGRAGCQRGGPFHQGCGACVFSGDYVLAEETACPDGGGAGGKDTAQLLEAGAARVFWLRCRRGALARGFAAFLDKAGQAGAAGAAPRSEGSLSDRPLVICESNSLREIVKPAVFIMLNNAAEKMKPSAARVARLADMTLDVPLMQTAIDEALRKCVFDE